MASVSSLDQRRFEDLYEAHALQVLAYCARRVGGGDAADATAETFLVVWRRIGEVPAPPAALPYLYGVARLVLANQRRSIRRRSRLDDRLRSLGVAPPPDPSVISLQTLDQRRVVDAVRRLPPIDREIVMLAAWEDLPRSAIAEIMGMTTAAVDQRIHRAYGRLARTLGSMADERSPERRPTAEETS